MKPVHPQVRGVVLAAVVGVLAAAPAVEGAVVTVPYKGIRQIQDLEAHGVQVIAFTQDGVDVEADGAAFDYLMSRPYAASAVVQPAAPQPGAQALDANLGQYHTYDETEALLGTLESTYPALADTIHIGKAYPPANRNLTAIKISDNVGLDEDEPEILYMGCHHARELMSVEIPLKFAVYLLENYGSNATVTQYVDTREIFIIPMANPDGHAYVQANHGGSSGSWWRKNRRDNGNGTFGVDLNRNYGYEWGHDNIGSSPTTSSEVYRGPAAFSEPETQAIRDFVAGRSFTTWLSYHSYGQLLLYPWGYVPAFTADHGVFAALGAELVAGTGYTAGDPALGTIYLTNGDADDWAYGEIATKNKIFGFTPEVNTLGQGGFAPAESLIQPTFDLLLNMNLKLLEWGDNPYRAVGPYAPAQYAVQAPYGNGVNRISWTAGDPSDPNPVLSYEVEGCLDPALSVDACTPALTGWTSNGFFYTASGFSGGGYNAGNGNAITHTLAMERTFRVEAATDSLRFRISYDVESNYDYGYVDVSTDGGTLWTTVAGNITTTFNPNGLNRGNGFTGTSGGWVSAVFPLTGYFGQEIMLRLAYITDGSVTGSGFTVDNLDPLVTCASVSTVASAVADTVYDHVPASTGLWLYRVRAKDAEDQWSAWSNGEERLVTTLTAVDAPRRYRTDIGANYPNPFNPSTQIPFVVGGGGTGAVRVELAVFSVTGARVATLVHEPRRPGTYVARWNGLDDSGTPAASGVYFARLVVDAAPAVVRKMVLLK